MAGFAKFLFGSGASTLEDVVADIYTATLSAKPYEPGFLFAEADVEAFRSLLLGGARGHVRTMYAIIAESVNAELLPDPWIG